MDIEKNITFINELWDTSIIPTLQEYIRIPNKSPLFDQNWETQGHMAKAVNLLKDWCLKQNIQNCVIDTIQLPGRTPLLFMEIAGQSDDTVLLYGHLDKQPEMRGWDEDLGPWKPVIKGDKLYGRGGADDGYAIFASLGAIKSLKAQDIPHARCIILIEACEESGSTDLPYYIEALKDRIGNPNLIICLDSGCGNYNQLWVTTSLRGVIGGLLSIDILKHGVHSGTGSGVAPSCFMVLRQLLDRIENKETGQILLKDLQVDIPPQRIEQANKTSAVLAKEIYESIAFWEGVQPVSQDPSQLLLNRTWRPALSVTGIDGLPKPENAGNVTIPSIKVKLSMRVAPTTDAKQACQQLKKILEQNPPFHANITFDAVEAGSGWNAPAENPWLTKAANQASNHYFGADAMYMGEGGSIPFMGMLGKKFPQAQFLITGVLGPESNAHGPNEFLHIPTAKKLTCCVADIIANHFRSANG